MALVWIATAPIYAAPAVRAFNRNDVVPDSVVTALSLEITGLVVREERSVATHDWRGTDPVTQAELEQLTETGRLSETALRAAFATVDTDQTITGAKDFTVAPTINGVAVGTGSGASTWDEIAGKPSLVTSTTVTSIVKLTQAEYDAIVTPDPATMYVVVG